MVTLTHGVQNGKALDTPGPKLFFLSLTGIQLWAHICAHLNFELRDCLITFPIFVPSQRLIARNVRELFSFNHGISHLNEACRIDDVSRGSLRVLKFSQTTSDRSTVGLVS